MQLLYKTLLEDEDFKVFTLVTLILSRQGHPMPKVMVAGERPYISLYRLLKQTIYLSLRI